MQYNFYTTQEIKKKSPQEKNNSAGPDSKTLSQNKQAIASKGSFSNI